MKPTKLLFLLLLAFTALSNAYSQDLLNLIPKDVNYAGMVDINQLNTKAKFAELKQLPFLEKVAEGMVKSIFRDTVKENKIDYLDLNKYGISTTGKAYFYYTSSKNINYGALLVSLTNYKEFTRFAKLATLDTTGTPMVVKNNCNYAGKKGLSVVWNNSYAAIMSASISMLYKDSITKILNGKYYTDRDLSLESSVFTDSTAEVIAAPESIATDGTPPPPPAIDEYNADTTVPIDTVTSTYNNYESNYEDSYTKIYNETDSICNSTVNAWLTANFETILLDKGANSLANSKNYIDFVKSKPDAAFMFNYEQFFNQYVSSVFGLSMLKTMKGLPFGNFVDWYKGSEILAKVELNKDDVQLDFDMKYGDQLAQIYKDIKKKKISPAFLKYMNKNLMGYWATGIDINGIAKGTGDMLRKTLPTIPQYGDIALSAMEVLDIAVDEQAIYNLLTGDMVLAVNGVKPMQVVHKTYKFDDDYNRSEVIDTSIQNQPEVLLMLGVGNKENVNKIIKLLVNLHALKQEKNFYGLEKNSSSFPFYLTLQDNILFFSNSKSFIQNPTVYADDQQLDKKHSKMFAANTTVLYVNMAQITGYYQNDTTNKYRSTFSDATKQFSDITMCGGNKGNYSSSHLIFKLKETNDNSLVDIIKFMNTIYVNEQKTRRYE